MKDLDILLLKNFIDDERVHIYRDEDNNIIIDGNIIIRNTLFTTFPVKVYKVNGNIEWHGNIGDITNGSLSSLINFPDIVNGNVNIYNNPYLKNLDGCPQYISGSLNCYNCNISDISGIGKDILNGFNCSNNPISDMSILESINIKGIIYAYNTYYASNNSNKIINDSSIILVSPEKNYI